MKAFQKAILASLLALLLLSLAAIFFTRHWASSPAQLNVSQMRAIYTADPVDTSALKTAEQLAPLAVTPEERDCAQEALRLADKSVDLAFTAALRDADENPPEPTPETRQLATRMKQAQADVAADEALVATLTKKLSTARRRSKIALQQKLDLAQAQLTLDKNEADDAHQDLIRAGGDLHATIQQQLDRHEASSQHGASHRAAATGAEGSSPEATESKSVLAELRAWFSLHTKETLLRQAQQNALDRAAKLSAAHDAFEKQVNEEKSQKRILHKKGAAAPQAAPAEGPGAAPAPESTLTFVTELTQHRKTLAEFSQRIQAEQALAANYGKWLTFADARSRAFLHGLFRSVFWILFIALLIFLANYAIHRFFADVSAERRELHAMRAALLLAVQALGLILILLVVLGIPNNFATVVALAGAGLTVALKDFIVGFLGWFVLIGKDGIRPGDWVEINGVGGEVLEVGPLHTILLETGNWTDAAHPTGRKVSFVNSFAIEGHYFNFSTSGQWLWDELQILVPVNIDPYSIAEGIQKITAEETAANARLAEKEWERVTPAYAKRAFTADPSMTVRPSGEGVNVLVRYITRASERQEVRNRLFRAVVDLLRKKNVPEVVSSSASAQSAGNRGV
jgi:small-conductance mechanosensitive channel